jgi:ribosomal RNA assembly protein
MFLKKNITGKILKDRKKIESKLNIKIKINGSNLEISGDEFGIYIAERVIEALEKNFPVHIALLLSEENYMLENLQIKSITNRKNLVTIRARIIGKEGKTLKLMSELSDCYITLNDNVVSIIGPVEKIKEAENAVKGLILGSKQTSVFRYLEKSRKKIYDEDLGLKIKKS